MEQVKRTVLQHRMDAAGVLQNIVESIVQQLRIKDGQVQAKGHHFLYIRKRAYNNNQCDIALWSIVEA